MTCLIFNSAPFHARSFPHETPDGEQLEVLVVKGTWKLSSGRLAPLEEQAPIRMLDETLKLGELELEAVQKQAISGRENDQWLRYETDFSPPKPNFDLIVNAWVQSKGKRFLRQSCTIEFRGKKLFSLIAHAPRIWANGLLMPVIQGLREPVLRVPAYNVFAFGGCANRHVGAAAQKQTPSGAKHWPFNQNGMGYCIAASKAAGVALPWLEAPKHSIAYWSDQPPVAALGHLSLADLPRRALRSAGGSQNKTQKTSTVEAVETIHPSGFNAAPPELQLSKRPKPGDTLDLWNLSQDGHCQFTFPDITLSAMGEGQGGQKQAPVKLDWDTLLIEPEADSAALVWRAALPNATGKLASITLVGESGRMA
jgi:hypothetical protein